MLQESHELCIHSVIKFSVNPDKILCAVEIFGHDCWYRKQTHNCDFVKKLQIDVYDVNN